MMEGLGIALATLWIGYCSNSSEWRVRIKSPEPSPALIALTEPTARQAVPQIAQAGAFIATQAARKAGREGAFSTHVLTSGDFQYQLEAEIDGEEQTTCPPRTQVAR
jgi:hypothetical protein